MAFTGFPSAAFDFYDDLEVDNSKTYWEANKATYLSAVREPTVALLALLESEFGAGKAFRPHRDVRFAKDKAPYKTHQGAFVPAAPATGWYLEVAASGFRVGCGFYQASPAGIAAIRQAIDGPDGAELQTLLDQLRQAGFTVGGQVLKTAPRGFSADHPRIELLRHKSITAVRSYGFDPVIGTAELADRVRDDWRRSRPLVEWVAAHLAGIDK